MADGKKSSISRRSSCYLLNLKQPEKTARRLKLSFQRTSGVVLLVKGQHSVEASVGFIDISETGAGIFTRELLYKGAIVELSISEPAPLKARGIVAWSAPLTSGIHAAKFRCRSGIQFVFDGEEQKAAVRDFVKKVGQDPIEILRGEAGAVKPFAEPTPVVPPAGGAGPAVPAENQAPVTSAIDGATEPSSPLPPPTSPAEVPSGESTPTPETALAAEAPSSTAPDGGGTSDQGGQQAA